MSHDPHEPLSQMVDMDGKKVPAILAEVFGDLDIESLRSELEEAKTNKEGLNLKYFKTINDWLITLVLVGLRHAIPNSTNEEAIEIGTMLAQYLRLPSSRPTWRLKAHEISRLGLSRMIVQVSLELTRGMYESK